MSKTKWKGGTLLAPVPAALITCSDGEHENVLTVAWTGIINSDPPKTYISVRPSRHSHGLIKKSGEFAINLTTKELVRPTDWCGVFTGAKVDKFERCKLQKAPANEISCPILAASPVVLECKVTDVISLGSHDMFLADITAVRVDESLLDEKGSLSLEKCRLTAYSHGKYYELVKPIASLGFAVKKHPPKQKGNRNGK